MLYLESLDVEPGGLVLGEVGPGRVHVGGKPLGQRVPQVGGLNSREYSSFSIFEFQQVNLR